MKVVNQALVNTGAYTCCWVSRRPPRHKTCSCETCYQILRRPTRQRPVKSRKRVCWVLWPPPGQNKKSVHKRGRRGIGRRSSSLTNAPCPAVAIAPSEPLYPIPSLRVGVPTTKERRDRRDDVRRKKFGDIAGSFSPETTCISTINLKLALPAPFVVCADAHQRVSISYDPCCPWQCSLFCSIDKQFPVYSAREYDKGNSLRSLRTMGMPATANWHPTLVVL